MLPTKRTSQRPLRIEEIDFVTISISADGGANYTEFGRYEPDELSTVITELEPGEWFVSGAVTDTNGNTGRPTFASKVIPDNSPPEALISLTLTL